MKNEQTGERNVHQKAEKLFRNKFIHFLTADLKLYVSAQYSCYNTASTAKSTS